MTLLCDENQFPSTPQTHFWAVLEYAFSEGQGEQKLDKYMMRHLMAAIIVSDELKVPNQRGGDQWMADDRMRKQFTQLIQNTYSVVDLMIEFGDTPPQQ